MGHTSQRPQPKKPAPPILALAVGGKVRSWRLRPGLCIAATIGVLSLAGLSIGANGYFIFQDNMRGTSAERADADQAAYEERIAALRAELERATNRDVGETRGVDDQVALLLSRQDALNARQQHLDTVLAKAAASGIAIAVVPPALPRARPIDTSPRHSADAPLAYSPSGGPEAEAAMRPLLQDVQSSLDAARDRQSQVLEALALSAREEAERIAGALRPIGFSGAEKFVNGIGGPYIPMSSLSFGEKADMLAATLDQVTGLRRATVELPLRQPLRDGRRTSSFGHRVDPFVDKPALHSGLDLAAPKGTDVRATAPGIVVTADWNGGYGQMVEIRHAHGFTTRYAHLSAIYVAPGSKVAAGTVIGAVGSTGRSTGPHLHYETRTGSGPVDPELFIAAGEAL